MDKVVGNLLPEFQKFAGDFGSKLDGPQLKRLLNDKVTFLLNHGSKEDDAKIPNVFRQFFGSDAVRRCFGAKTAEKRRALKPWLTRCPK